MRRDIPPARKRGGNSLEQAIWAAERGMAVLEIVPGSKLPARKWKYLGLRTPDQLSANWMNRCDVGVMCGPSDLVDVEVDGKHGEALLESTGLVLPVTAMEILTKSGSHHRVFRARGTHYKSHRLIGDDCRPKGCGVDVKGWGGYFLLFSHDREVTFYG
jgi:hypothetical protein